MFISYHLWDPVPINDKLEDKENLQYDNEVDGELYDNLLQINASGLHLYHD